LERWNEDHVITEDTMKEAAVAAEGLLFGDWVDATEDGVGSRLRGFTETMQEEALDGVLSRTRYRRRKASDGDGEPPFVGRGHGHRKRSLNGTSGRTWIALPRARLLNEGDGGRAPDRKSQTLRAYQRRTNAADALIVGAYFRNQHAPRPRGPAAA
jgi:putative transposase